MRRIKFALAVGWLLFLASRSCLASSIVGATVEPNNDGQLVLSLLFSAAVTDKTQLSQLSNYLLLDTSSGRFIPIVDVLPQKTDITAELLLDPTVRITQDSKLHLFIKALTLKGDKKPNTLNGPVAVRLVSNAGLPQDKGSQHLVAAGKGKDDSDIYLSGQANGARSQKFTYAADVKLSFPFKTVLFSRVHTFAPVFTYTASTDPKANPDTLGLGLDWSFFPL